MGPFAELESLLPSSFRPLSLQVLVVVVLVRDASLWWRPHSHKKEGGPTKLAWGSFAARCCWVAPKASKGAP